MPRAAPPRRIRHNAPGSQANSEQCTKNRTPLPGRQARLRTKECLSPQKGRPRTTFYPAAPLTPHAATSPPPLFMPVDNFRETVDNLLNAYLPQGLSNRDFQSIRGVVFRDTPYLPSRHAASRGETRRIPKRTESSEQKTERPTWGDGRNGQIPKQRGTGCHAPCRGQGASPLSLWPFCPLWPV